MKVYSDTTYFVIDNNEYFKASEWFGKRFFKLANKITKQTDLYNPTDLYKNTVIFQIIDYKKIHLIIKK